MQISFHQKGEDTYVGQAHHDESYTSSLSALSTRLSNSKLNEDNRKIVSINFQSDSKSESPTSSPSKENKQTTLPIAQSDQEQVSPDSIRCTLKTSPRFQRKPLKLFQWNPKTSTFELNTSIISVLNQFKKIDSLSIVGFLGWELKALYILDDILTIKKNGFAHSLQEWESLNQQAIWMWGQPLNLNASSKSNYALILFSDFLNNTKIQVASCIKQMMQISSCIVPIIPISRTIEGLELLGSAMSNEISGDSQREDSKSIFWISTNVSCSDEMQFVENSLVDYIPRMGGKKNHRLEIIFLPQLQTPSYNFQVTIASKKIFSGLSQLHKSETCALGRDKPVHRNILSSLIDKSDQHSQPDLRMTQDSVNSSHNSVQEFEQFYEDRPERVPSSSSRFPLECSKRDTNKVKDESVRGFLEENFVCPKEELLAKIPTSSLPMQTAHLKSLFSNYYEGKKVDLSVLLDKWTEIYDKNEESKYEAILKNTDIILKTVNLQNDGSGSFSINNHVKSIIAAIPLEKDSLSAFAKNLITKCMKPFESFQSDLDKTKILKSENAALLTRLNKLQALQEQVPPESGSGGNAFQTDYLESKAQAGQNIKTTFCLPFKSKNAMSNRISKTLAEVQALKDQVALYHKTSSDNLIQNGSPAHILQVYEEKENLYLAHIEQLTKERLSLQEKLRDSIAQSCRYEKSLALIFGIIKEHVD